MNTGKDLNKEIIHRLLDDDLGLDEEKTLMEQVQADPALQKEFDGLTEALRAVETSERIPAPPFFTAEVMRRLLPRKENLAKRMLDFLFKGRVFKWNMAAALATVGLVALVLTQVVHINNRNRPVETAVVPQQDQVVTVTMNLYAPQAHHVAVAGTFNKWKVAANVLTKQENGVWTINIPLKPGEYSYMFIVDGKAWVTDPNAEAYHDDGFGYKNAVVRVNI
jgi:anti-sigma-K factor RskA